MARAMRSFTKSQNANFQYIAIWTQTFEEPFQTDTHNCEPNPPSPCCTLLFEEISWNDTHSCEPTPTILFSAVYLFLSHIFGWNSFDLTLQGMPFIFVNWNYCICFASAQDFSFLFWLEIFTHQPLWGDSFYIFLQNPILYISACDPNVFFRQHWNK